MSPEQIFEQSAQFIETVMYGGIFAVCVGIVYVLISLLFNSKQ